KMLIEWLKSRAREHFGARAAHYAARLDLPAPPVAISGARTRWGACTSDGRIRFTWRLAMLDPELGDYVVAHEVAHLIELNHSPRFWALVESLLPDHLEQRRHLDALTPLLD
ncbi:MAG TPA: SprT family zinc-dependent metalloprotease, partial [Casimicrobiaceae bacterium]|nr:SprT family zinc-dependent metalloprotease [Casimicrobiaceae bacterium]